MRNYNLEELKLSKWQFGLTVLFIILLFISLTLTYNQILKFQNKEPLYNKKTSNTVLKFYRVAGFIIALGFLLIDLIDREIKKENNINTKTAELQIYAGILTVISTIIVLYVAFIGNGFTDIENPE